MSTRPGPTISQHFAPLPDPRVERTKYHRWPDMIVMALCAIVAGADT